MGASLDCATSEGAWESFCPANGGPPCPGAAAWLPCLANECQDSSPSVSRASRRRVRSSRSEEAAGHIEELMMELFRLHDLNGNGLLEESELVQLNERIAFLHHGPDTDTAEVRSKYQNLFRAKLDPDGRPVPYEIFHAYAGEVLDGLDTDPEAQEMILEQFVAEAKSGRQAFGLPLLFNEDLGLPTIEAHGTTHVCGWIPDCRLENPCQHYSVRNGGWLVHPTAPVRSNPAVPSRMTRAPRSRTPILAAQAAPLRAVQRPGVPPRLPVSPPGSYNPPPMPGVVWGMRVPQAPSPTASGCGHWIQTA